MLRILLSEMQDECEIDPSWYKIAGMQFDHTIKWGGEHISVSNGRSPDEAKIKAIWMAEKQGWTNPSWYEFWRHWRGDDRFDPAEIARLKAKYEGDNQLSEEVS